MQIKDVFFLIIKTLKLEDFNWKNKTKIKDRAESRDDKNYRIVIINDVDFSESFSATVTRKKTYVFICICFVISFLFWFLMFAYTPAKAILPENLNYNEKRKLISLKKKTDSLESIFKLNEQFIQHYKNIFISTPSITIETNKKSKK